MEVFCKQVYGKYNQYLTTFLFVSLLFHNIIILRIIMDRLWGATGGQTDGHSIIVNYFTYIYIYIYIFICIYIKTLIYRNL